MTSLFGLGELRVREWKPERSRVQDSGFKGYLEGQRT